MANKKQPKKNTQPKPKAKKPAAKKPAAKTSPTKTEKATVGNAHESGHSSVPETKVDSVRITVKKKKSLLKRIFGS